LLWLGTGGAATSDIAGRGPAILACGGAFVPVGTGTVHLKEINLEQSPSSLAIHSTRVNGTRSTPMPISHLRKSESILIFQRSAGVQKAVFRHAACGRLFAVFTFSGQILHLMYDELEF
jgi:hypothetical protein